MPPCRFHDRFYPPSNMPLVGRSFFSRFAGSPAELPGLASSDIYALACRRKETSLLRIALYRFRESPHFSFARAMDDESPLAAWCPPPLAWPGFLDLPVKLFVPQQLARRPVLVFVVIRSVFFFFPPARGRIMRNHPGNLTPSFFHPREFAFLRRRYQFFILAGLIVNIQHYPFPSIVALKRL